MKTEMRHDSERPITLYNFAMSPFGMKVHSFLLFKKLNFDVFYVNPLRFKREIPTGRQIPVLQVGRESMSDSTPIGVWLDELFPEEPRLLPGDGGEKKELLEINEWVTDRLIPIVFRIPQEPGINLLRIRNGWKLARAMNRTCNGGLPKMVEWLWPLILFTQPFLRQELAKADPHRPLEEVKEVMYQEFQERLGSGPFFHGRSTPSLPDVAAYPQFLLPYFAGMDDADYFLEYPRVVEWLKAMEPFVQGSPPLLPKAAHLNHLPWDQD